MTAETSDLSEGAGQPLAAPAVPELTLPGYVLGQALERGSKLALVNAATGAALTYAELAAATARAGAALAAHGVASGDVLALCAPNSIEFAVTYLAAASANAVVTTVNPLWTEPEISRQLQQTGARWLVGTAGLLAGKLGAPARTGRRSRVIRDQPPRSRRRSTL